MNTITSTIDRPETIQYNVQTKTPPTTVARNVEDICINCDRELDYIFSKYCGRPDCDDGAVVTRYPRKRDF